MVYFGGMEKSVVDSPEFWKRMQESPADFSLTWLDRHDLYDWQANAMDAVAEPKSQVTLVTCNESGKTSVCIHDLILWHMSCYPGSTTITTSAAVRQVRAQLYPHLAATLARNQHFKGWKIKTGAQLEVSNPIGSRCISFVAADPGKAEGFHADDFTTRDVLGDWEPPEDWGDVAEQIVDLRDAGKLKVDKSLLIIVDEAKSVPVEIFEALGRCRADRYFMASSPEHGDPTGFFYESFHRNAPHWRRYKAPWTKCPHLYDDPVERAHCEREISQFGGIDTSYIRSRFGAEFTHSTDCMVFAPSNIAACMMGTYQTFGNDRRLALDLSGGGDKIIGYLRTGNHGKVEIESNESDSYKLVKNVLIPAFKRLGLQASEICADNGGLGKPIIDHMVNLGWDIERIDFGGKPQEDLYLNVRAEMYFGLAHRMMAGEVSLLRNDFLEDQLKAMKFIMRERKLALVKKEKLKGALAWTSPDEADACVMAFYKARRAFSYKQDHDTHRRKFSTTLIDYEPEENDEMLVC